MKSNKSHKRIFLSPPWMSGDELPLINEAFASNYIAPCGPMVERFEREFAEKTGFPQACALSSGTAGLDLLFDLLKISPGDTVVCSDLTFISSIAPAFHRGARPVFVDSDSQSWNISPHRLKQALQGLQEKGVTPKAVVAVDLYGQCCDYGRIEKICADFNVPLIIDSAEALGATYKERNAGQAGIAAAFSFNGNKIITTSGGGMLVSHDSDLIAQARKLSQQSRENFSWYEHLRAGYNYRMSNIVAAIGVGQLMHLPEILARKRKIFSWYQESLADFPQVSFMPEATYGKASRWLTVVRIAPKKRHPNSAFSSPAPHILHILDVLGKEMIEARPVWKPMHLQPVFKGADFVSGKTPISSHLFENGLCLPSGCALTRSQVQRISRIVGQTLP